MPHLDTSAATLAHLGPAVRDRTHWVILTDHRAGHADLVAVAARLGLARRDSGHLTSGCFEVLTPGGRSLTVSFLTAPKALVPVGELAAAFRAAGLPVGPVGDRDLFALAAGTGEDLAVLLDGLRAGGLRPAGETDLN